ncbi:hypothetical protein ACQRO7_006426 [Pseudomonas aeruginosa]|uniref:hypothetical protein n=1 Tax=Pseudomonas aeruginosa TaxID=287 RepID=UPI000B43C73C|nr:hypothetical protein [Pseudomonas aeruginosa]EHR2651892.1 hypothetical protein [Escherichia coli]ASA15965.1 hypothetical protein CDL16_17950 [Pseudomonas aeruginosa]EIU3605246.1 hypothetical protein [Pseudomonas aeruginosa]EIU3805138.1 hypothetical protein [Pseudomonas aeruginosa]EKU8359843.1 hypothetical protein [Pseudomonas aeruginosa]
MAQVIHSLLLRLGRERVTNICCVLGTCLAVFVERDALMNGPPAAQLGTIALAIAVPILYLTPLVWLVYRYLVRPNHENR